MSDIENAHRRSMDEAQATIRLFSEYWRQALGPYLLGSPKERTHESFAQWLSDCTCNLRADVDDARAIIAAVDRWKSGATVARTLGVPEPSITTYLPTRSGPPTGGGDTAA